jgi:hypothetical protein
VIHIVLVQLIYMKMEINENAVRHAIERLGGATKSAIKTESSTWSVHHWVRISRIPSYSKAVIVAELSGIPLEQLWQPKSSPTATAGHAGEDHVVQ